MQNKARIDRLIHLYISDMEESAVNEGWKDHCNIYDFIKHGVMPQSKGSGHSDPTASAAERVKDSHSSLADIQACMTILKDRKLKYYLSIMSKHFYTHTFLDPSDQRIKAYSDENRASLVGVAYRNGEQGLFDKG